MLKSGRSNDEFLSVCFTCFECSCEGPLDCGSTDSSDTNDFIATAEAGGNGNGGVRYFQKIRKKIDARAICLALDWRSSNFELECISQHT